MKHLLYRAQFRAREYWPHGSFPVHIDIELAGKCQLACRMCPYGTGQFDSGMQGMMSETLALKALKQAIDGGAKSIKFNFRGEPGLSHQLELLTEIAKDRGIVETSINTNLTAFSERRLERLCKSLDLMIVSIDGGTKETYEAIRVGGDWNKLWDNLTFIHNQPKRPRLRLQMVVQKANEHEVGLARRHFRWMGDEIIIRPVMDRGAGEGLRGERKKCPQPWQRLVVAWDGTIFACCGNWNNEWPLGTLKECSLQEAWDGYRMKELREKAEDPNSGYPCKDCSVGASYKK